jgi:hypothetical protein
MGDSYPSLADEAASLCELIQSQVEELEAIEEAIAAEDAAAAGGSGISTSTPVGTKAAVPPLEGFSASDFAYSGGEMFCADTFFDDDVVVNSFEVDQQSAPVQRVAFLSGSAYGFEDFGNGSEDGDVTVLASAMDKTNVDRMLAGSVKVSTLAKYSRLWDKWLAFSAFHEVDTMSLRGHFQGRTSSRSWMLRGQGRFWIGAPLFHWLSVFNSCSGERSVLNSTGPTLSGSRLSSSWRSNQQRTCPRDFHSRYQSIRQGPIVSASSWQITLSRWA